MLQIEKTELKEYGDIGFGEVFFWDNAYWVAEIEYVPNLGYRSICIFPLDRSLEVKYLNDNELVTVCKVKEN